MAFQPRITDPVNLDVRFQEFSNSLGVLYMALHAQAQGFQTLQEQPRVERRLAGSDIPQYLHPGFEDIGSRAQVRINKPMVAAVWFGEIGEAPAGFPVEITTIDDHASDGGAVPADELGRGVHQDISAPLQGSAQIRRGEGVIDH